MARADDAIEWLKKGHSPSRIAEAMKVSRFAVMGFLYRKLWEGEIRRADVLFSVDKNVRQLVEAALAEGKTDVRAMWRRVQKRGHSVHLEDLETYLQLREARVSLGDMYELLRDIELWLHGYIKEVLSKGHGSRDWWRKGIPEGIRVECVSNQQRDPEPAEDPYSYTTFIQVKEILDKRWGIFSKTLPAAVSTDKKALLSTLEKLNRIRNSVMHPVKGKELTEDDFVLVREFHAKVHPKPKFRKRRSRSLSPAELEEWVRQWERTS